MEYLKYYENDLMSFTCSKKEHITLLGKKNKDIVSCLLYKSPNNYIWINNEPVTLSNLYEYRKKVSISSYLFIDLFLTETIDDELAYPLESLKYKKEEIETIINETKQKFKLELVSISPYNLSISQKAKLSLACSLITNPKILIIDNILSLLDYNDYYLVTNILKNYKNNGGIILNFTDNIEETLLSDKTVVTDTDKILISGKTLSVLNEEKIMKRLGYSLPLIVLLNKYLMDYNLIDNITLDYRKLVNLLW